MKETPDSAILLCVVISVVEANIKLDNASLASTGKNE
jgi:hypothetical protein